MRLIPEVRVLCARARRPALRIVLGGVLMVPAAVLMASGQLDLLAERQRAQSAQRAAQAHDAQADPVVRAWSQRVQERERELVVASFAREFDIPVKLAANIHSAAVAERIAPRVAFGLVQAESSFRPRVVSSAGAVGLTQLLPSTARWLVPGTTRTDLMQPETNLRVGFQYLRYLLDKFEGDERLALTAYNRGPGTVDRLLKRGADPDNGYADKVLTGESARHVRLMNAKFGGARKRT